MPRKKKELIWNVYVENFNRREIEIHNVFDHVGFLEDVRKDYKKCKNDFAAFEEKLKSNVMYYYWSKCEWEIILTSWPPRKDFKESKIDVYDQLRLNWDEFVKYTWTALGGTL